MNQLLGKLDPHGKDMKIICNLYWEQIAYIWIDFEWGDTQK